MELNKKTIILLILSIYTVAMLVAAGFNLFNFKKDVSSWRQIDLDYSLLREKPRSLPVTGYFNILNGTTAETPVEAAIIPLAVVIDNNFKGGASGLNQADLVVEFPVEGGVTRFVAFFDPSLNIKKIGPVRSVRPYFIDFSAGLHALIAHSGGSPIALELLAGDSLGVINVDEIGPRGVYFWRDNKKSPPHNLFTSTDLLRQAQSALAPDWLNEFDYQKAAWLWKYPVESNEPATEMEILAMAPGVAIDYSTEAFRVEYRYDFEKLVYVRYQGGELQLTADGDKLVADNLLISYMPIQVIDEIGRLKMDTVGQNKAIICQRGQCREGIWTISAADARIRFNVDEKEVEMIPGHTWLNIVPIGRGVSY
ncbi:MAG: hypothetical protein A2445_03075 [Candidatus Jacksonbacteria bacterium RIFOXYC2_FULL_44_29]|nr:MAG: hypothetical protein UW45_C0006G0005 [Parcubacteria group bacterium GW2011_GWC2_44_22]OGY75696.1 MAG: hypothetical protein A2240_04055 [Candidatus Jacksonbacteria bacterium RIFOXYA2_FULL_43_12]OGY76173.1 MAG: hypothetical protein A2295_03545 [Candidatus Jacksonbacteria bacterium RIFOXYB2_FULL_44_15]OGY80079.1 MAG: hypothetical protein A2445_03075 [Candidatus Jacksonbacteria bacterium RIFOXYC2_FULL_44_29]OGY81738.1 MAG: hypothetical protein A2550_01045 [Candidatus Jacksonbacteria bacteri